MTRMPNTLDIRTSFTKSATRSFRKSLTLFLQLTLVNKNSGHGCGRMLLRLYARLLTRKWVTKEELLPGISAITPDFIKLWVVADVCE